MVKLDVKHVLEQVTLPKVGITFAVFAVLSLAFYLLAFPGFGYDWVIISEGIKRFARGGELYEFHHYQRLFSGFYSPPWTTALLFPLGILPTQIGFAMIQALTLICSMILCHHFKVGSLKTVLFLLSPPIIYNLIQGQIDALALMFLFLPREWWVIVAVAKPQVLLGFIFGILRTPSHWVRAAIITAVVLAISFLIFGLWPLKILELQAAERLILAPQNVLLGLWPFQLVIGLGLASVAMERDDKRLYLAASPFLLPYASTGSYMGALLAVMASVKNWQAALIWFTWWAAVAVRGLG